MLVSFWLQLLLQVSFWQQLLSLLKLSSYLLILELQYVAYFE
jgi:hypothetical protein